MRINSLKTLNLILSLSKDEDQNSCADSRGQS